MSKAYDERRLAMITVSTKFIENILCGGNIVCVSTTAPNDLEIVCLEQDAIGRLNGIVRIICASMSFEAIRPGGKIPEFNPEYTVDAEITSAVREMIRKRQSQ